ncbi:hypothetical protein THRCLA_02297, partial [Thraustotheca clavata]
MSASPRPLTRTPSTPRTACSSGAQPVVPELRYSEVMEPSCLLTWLHLSDAEKHEYAKLGYKASAELIELASLSRNAKLKANGKDSAFCRQTSIIPECISLQDYIDRVHPNEYKGFDDTMHLCTIEDENDGGHYHMRLQWGLLRSPWTQDREFYYLEIQHIFIDTAGLRGYARCLISVPLSLDLMPIKRIKGSLHHSGIIVKETMTPGVMEEVILINMSLGGSVPSFVTNFVAKALLKRTCQLQVLMLQPLHLRQHKAKGLFAQRRISIWSEEPLKGSHDKKFCKECSRNLPWYRLRFKCVVCSETVCKYCTKQNELGWNKNDRVCGSCNEAINSMQAKPRQSC